jgi:hypothetical protein
VHVTLTGGLVPPAPPSGGRKIPVVSKGHFTGHLVIGDEHGEGRVVEVESHLEMQTALILLARRDIVDIENQVPFEWINEDGEVRDHFFDFKAYHRDGSRTAIMVKPLRRLESERFVAEAHRIAAQVTPAFADKVTLFTDADVDPIELHSAELFHAMRTRDPEADAAMRRLVAGVDGAVRIADLVSHSGLEGRGFRALVRLIAAGALETCAFERIGYETLVRRGRA